MWLDDRMFAWHTGIPGFNPQHHINFHGGTRLDSSIWKVEAG